MTYNFTTLFDKSYLARGLVLYDSLLKHCNDFKLYILCLDAYTYKYLNNNLYNYKNIFLLDIKELELYDRELLTCKNNRSLIEYYFTISPCLPRYILNRFKLDHICLIDADLYFLNNPETIFKKLNSYSIVITKHDFSIENKSSIKYGKFNVSFQIFKNDSLGNQCLEYWRMKCIESCKDNFDPIKNTFADQLYLDEWEIIYNKYIYLLDSSNCGLAPWNFNKCNIILKNNIYYNGIEKIIFIHFHGIKFFNNYIVANSFNEYKVKYTKNLSLIYCDYIHKLTKKINTIDLYKESKIRYKISFLKLITTSFFIKCNKRLININIKNAFFFDNNN